MALINKAKAAKAETAAKTETAKVEAAPKAEKAPAKKPAAKRAPAKKAAAPVVNLTVQYLGKEMTQQAMVEAVEAQVQEEIKTLELYVKPEDNAVYYVVNGTVTGQIEF